MQHLSAEAETQPIHYLSAEDWPALPQAPQPQEKLQKKVPTAVAQPPPPPPPPQQKPQKVSADAEIVRTQQPPQDTQQETSTVAEAPPLQPPPPPQDMPQSVSTDVEISPRASESSAYTFRAEEVPESYTFRAVMPTFGRGQTFYK